MYSGLSAFFNEKYDEATTFFIEVLLPVDVETEGASGRFWGIEQGKQ